MHAIGRRWIDNGENLTALARTFGCAYTTLYGQLRGLGYSLDQAVGARPGRRTGNMTDDTESAPRPPVRARLGRTAMGRRARDGALHRCARAAARGRVPKLATLVERNSSLADLSR
ncbi:MAG: hypothetical protein WDO24_23195 [Pseudomonadota bacterium]